MPLALSPGSAVSPGKTFGPKAPAVKSTGDDRVDQEIDKVAQATTETGANEATQGRVIYNVRLEAMTNTPIEHGLGTKPKGFSPSGLSTVAIIFQTEEPDERIITLKSTAAITCSIRIW